MSSFIISLAIRLTILMMLGGLVALAARRSTYAVRHIIVAATLACAIALPAMMLAIPQWRVGVLPAAPAAAPLYSRSAISPSTPSAAIAPAANASLRPVLVTSYIERATTVTVAATKTASASASPKPAPVAQSSVAPIAAATLPLSPAPAPAPTSAPAPAPFAPTASQIALGIWLLGMLIGLAWIALGRIALARIRRRATPLASEEWRAILEAERANAGVEQQVALLESRTVTSPVTWGLLSPVIVLPSAAHSWTLDRKRVVVMHEMAHIARRDSATQLAATLASIVYWVHPLVLLAARRLRAECERACDERVLELGTPATDYAAHLLDVAKFARSFGAASIVSVAMARPSQLEGRLIAVLRSSPHRGRASARSRAAATLFAATMLIAISAFMPVERDVTPPSALRSSRLSRVSELPNGRALASVTSRGIRSQDTAGPTWPAAPVAPAAPAAPAQAAQPAPFFSANTIAAWTASALGAPAKPDTTFTKSVPAKSGGTLDLDLDTGGDIMVTGTDDAKVTVDASLGGSSWRQTTVSLDGSGGDVRLESRYERSFGNSSFDNKFTIRVPRKFNVHVSSAGGSVAISGVEGTFRGTTGGGPITIDHAKGDAQLSTGGGDIRISDSHLEGSVKSGGGTVFFNNVTGGIIPAAGNTESYGNGYFYGFGAPKGSYKMPKFKVMVPKMKMNMSDLKMNMSDLKMNMSDLMMDMPNMNFDMPNVQFRTLDSEQMKKMKKMMEEQGPELERAREAMESAERTMRENEESIERARIDLQNGDDSVMPDSAMERIRESLERHRGAMDSARVVLRQNQEIMNRALESVRESREASVSSPRIVKMKSMRMQDGNVIIIDKDGGDIDLDAAPHGARVSTGGGTIVVGRARGTVSAHTGGGDIEIGPSEGAAAATTDAGDVSINLVGEGAHPVDVSSGKGNIQIFLPKDANATLDLETAYTENYHGHPQIKGDWPLTVTETNEWDSSQGTPRKYVRVQQKIGKGGPVIRVRTVNGDICLRRGS
jgi:beta-lactamase regulating signal transducer with metallopeptidase domain